MRRLFVLAVFALLGLGPVEGFFVSAQEHADDAWLGVSAPAELTDQAFSEQAGSFLPGFGLQLTPFRVGFENLDADHRAYIPEIQGTEFMVVVVEEGEFVLDVKGPGSYLVNPADGAIQIMHGTIVEDGTGIEYTEATGQVIRDETGSPCETMCTVLPGFAVLLSVDDQIIAPAGAICTWCLLNGTVENGMETGSLLAYALLRGGAADTFSWNQNHKTVATASAQEGVATVGTISNAMAWAFNPGSNCRG